MGPFGSWWQTCAKIAVELVACTRVARRFRAQLAGSWVNVRNAATLTSDKACMLPVRISKLPCADSLYVVQCTMLCLSISFQALCPGCLWRSPCFLFQERCCDMSLQNEATHTPPYPGKLYRQKELPQVCWSIHDDLQMCPCQAYRSTLFCTFSSMYS